MPSIFSSGPIGYSYGNAGLAMFMGWFVAQSIKVITGAIREKRINFRWFVQTGGMPSSHSSLVACTTTVAGYEFGFNSVLFQIILVFAIIVMVDAAGFRRAAGKQASVLNNMLDDIYEKGAVTEGRITELLGHTPIEVFAGMALGISIAILFHN